MTLDQTSFEERRYTRQHDRVFHAVVQQVQELDTRLRYLEGLLEPATENTPPDVRMTVDEVRSSSQSLADKIATIGASLDAVVEALDSTTHPAAAPKPPRPPQPPPSPAQHGASAASTELTDDADEDGDDVVVDLESGRNSRRSWRSNSRQPGWMPVTNT